MLFLILSSNPDFLPVTRIKVPGRNADDNPGLAFASKEIGRFFMKARQISEDQHQLTDVGAAHKLAKIPKYILIFQSEQQVLDSLADPEGYDYESLIESFEN